MKAFRTLVEKVQANDKKTKFLLMQAAQKMRSQQEVICASAKRNLIAKGRKTPRNSWWHFYESLQIVGSQVRHWGGGKVAKILWKAG